MDADEQAIVDYLKSWPGQFVAARQISRRAGGKRRYQEHPEWAKAVLLRLVEQGLLESDTTGHYRLLARANEKKSKGKKWVSPQVRQILEQSGKDFGELLAPEDQDDFYTNR